PVAAAVHTAYGHLSTIARAGISSAIEKNAHYRIPLQILMALEDSGVVPRLVDQATGIPSLNTDEKGVE
ncbi:MAG: hypothetical protein ACRDKE_13130, partial [Solirubrobacterales bacterium]